MKEHTKQMFMDIRMLAMQINTEFDFRKTDSPLHNSGIQAHNRKMRDEILSVCECMIKRGE